MSRSRDFGAAAGSLAAPSSSYNGYSHVVDTTQASGWNFAGNQAAGKNLIVNGGFDYWQRGISFTSATYTADRWFQYGNDTITRQSFTAASPEIPNGLYYLRYQATQTGAYHYIEQRIENGHNDLSGRTVTISFWARSNTGSNGTFSILTALSNDTQLYSANFTTTTTWTKYYATFNIATLNYAATYRYLRMGGIGDSGGVDLAQVQYEIGSAPTQFSRAGGSLGGELLLCQRYFEKSYDIGVAPGTNTGENNGNICSALNNPSTYLHSMYVQYKVPKRIVPTITYYDMAGNSGFVSYVNIGSSPTNSITAGLSFSSFNGFQPYVNNSANISGFELHYTASADL